jgi:hypothetical protein
MAHANGGLRRRGSAVHGRTRHVLAGLARAASYDPSHLSKVLNGRKPHPPQLAARLDDVLDAGGKIRQAAAVFNGSLAPDQRDRLDWTARKPRAADMAAVEALADVLAAQRRAEDCLGSEAMLRPVRAQIAVVEDLVSEARGKVRPRLVHVAGQWAQYLGWLYANTGSQAKGEDRLRQALQWATEAGDVNLISEVLSFQGHAAWIAGQPGPLIGLSQAARRHASAYPGQLAISAAQEAQGRAMTGDAHDVDRLLDEADELAARAREQPDDAPPWLYYHSPGFFALQRGLAYRYLASDPAYRTRAEAALAAGHAQLPPGDQSSEWGAEFLVYLADVHARGGDLEQACAIALVAATAGRQMDSARLLGMLRRLRAGLAARWPDDPRVAELAEALR